MFNQVSSHRAQWILPAAVLLIAVAALVSARLAHRWLAAAMVSESTLQATIRLADDEQARAAAPSCAPEFSYAQELPASISMDKLVQSLQDSSRAFGVTLVGVTGEPRAATTRSLASLSVNISLRGAYPAIKSALTESLSRFPTATLQQIHFKRAGMASPSVEDASVQLAFALRPPLTGPLDCRLAPASDEVMESKW